MDITATFMLAAALSPIFAGSLLRRITKLGPEAISGNFTLPTAVLTALATAIGTFFADPNLWSSPSSQPAGSSRS